MHLSARPQKMANAGAVLMEQLMLIVTDDNDHVGKLGEFLPEQ
jgi:hypothetical protein